MSEIKLMRALSRYKPGAALIEAAESAMLESMNLDRTTLAMELQVRFSRYVSEEEIDGICAGVGAAYGLRSVRLTPSFPAEALTEPVIKDMLFDMAKAAPVLEPLAASCAVETDGAEVGLCLPECYKGIALMLKFGEGVEKQAMERFGLRVKAKLAFSASDGPDPIEHKVKQALSETASGKGEAPRPAQQPPQKPERKTGPRTPRAPKPKDIPEEDVLMGEPFGEQSMPMTGIENELDFVAVRGTVFKVDFAELPGGKTVAASMDITDKTGAVRVKKLIKPDEAERLRGRIKEGVALRVRGRMEYDRYYGEKVLNPKDMYITELPIRRDDAPKKRVELHMHTNMSRLDGISSAEALIKRAEYWGQPAVAITDHGVTQAFPEALHAASKTKVLYGCEGYFVNDLPDGAFVFGECSLPLSGEFVCFDLETTGTDPKREGITEIAAAVVKNGEITEEFQTYTNPHRPISAFITDLTGITNEMVADAISQEEGVERFIAFAAGRPVVAHNASFDVGFIKAVCERQGKEWDSVYIDTLELSRAMLPGLPKYKLDAVAAGLKLPEFRHHTADADTRTLALIFIELLKRLAEAGAENVGQINDTASAFRREHAEDGTLSSLPSRHIILIAKNRTGIVNLYRLVSYGHVKYMRQMGAIKQPIIPRHELDKYREGLIVGSACEAGELFRALLDGASQNELKKIAKYYDFLEIQPLGNNEFLTLSGYRRGRNDAVIFSKDDLIRFNKTIVKLGEELGIPVVATGDVHFLDEDDAIYRAIIMNATGFDDALRQAPLFMRTTDEMLAEFDYLGKKKAMEVVVDNTNLIADMCENVKPFPDGLFPPELPGSAEDLQRITWAKAKELYGEPLPELVKNAIDRELTPIISHGYDVMYMFAQKLIRRSEEHGYVVGSRGSVGSSIVAYFSGITEINSLPPHYRCPKCKYVEFHPEADCGLDMEPKACPKCGEKLICDGFDIPFETFLGFNCDKDPDIDLNFSSEYQAQAHRHTVELFGEESVFRAGTITTLAEANAFGYVKKYCEKTGKTLTRAEMDRLASGCIGVKQTTGQHPGGLVVVPRNKEIYEFCPVQYPADKNDGSSMVTTHVDYHSIDTNLLKFDILGKDDPTILRYLEDNTGVKMADVPLHDEKALGIFTSNEPLGLENDEIIGLNGALGIPEFGTNFVRGMLDATEPTSIADLIRISGLSHGTDVWLGNAETLVSERGMKLCECICCRDDIMKYLIGLGLPPKDSFKIMELVRKGRKLTPEYLDEMKSKGVPEWYIDCCKKIKYLFPKAHAAAYVVMALRIAWYKVYEPLAYYGSFFGIKAAALDGDIMLAGDNAVCAKLRQIKQMPAKELTATDSELRRTLEITHEFLLRGFSFLPVDVTESYARLFRLYPEQNALRLPFTAIDGLGETAAQQIVEERDREPFSTVENFAARCGRVSATVTDTLRDRGAFGATPNSNQMELF